MNSVGDWLLDRDSGSNIRRATNVHYRVGGCVGYGGIITRGNLTVAAGASRGSQLRRSEGTELLSGVSRQRAAGCCDSYSDHMVEVRVDIPGRDTGGSSQKIGCGSRQE